MRMAIIIALLFLGFQFSTLTVAQAQQAPARGGVATSLPLPGVQTNGHAMLALPRSITGQPKANAANAANAQPSPDPNAPKPMPVLRPSVGQ
jgi:hypothetical protein